jgi:hypothetical protein
MAETFIVLSQQQTTALGPGGQVEDVMEVTAQTVSGVVFSERIPLSAYSAENVHALLAQRAEEIERVQAL